MPRRKPTTTASNGNSGSGNMLSAVARLSEAERRLTQTLDKTSRYLPNSKDPLLLPTPQSREEVKTVLAVALTYADRTSAPSGWNPNVPIYGFVTPNPLPHQLRGGQLAALQLQQAQEDRERKRKAVREEQENKKRKQKKKKTEEMESQRMAVEEAADHDGDVKMEEADTAVVDPKRRELDVMHEREDMVGEEDKAPQTEEEAARKERQRQAQREREARQKAMAAAAASATSRRREVPATMNLSDSSSSEEEESDESE